MKSSNSNGKWLLIAALMFIMALSAAACSSDDSGTDGDNDNPVDGDTTEDGDIEESADGDVAEEDGDVDDTPDGDAESTGEADVEAEKPDPTKFMVGYAEVEVTPPVGTALGGYGAPGGGRQSTGTHDPLMSQVAFIANDAGDAMIIMSYDTTGFFFEFGEYGPGIQQIRESIVEAIKPDFNIVPESIVVGNSHSHVSADLMGLWKLPDVSLLEEQVTKLTAAALEAKNNLQEAKLFFGYKELPGYTSRDNDCSPIIDNSVNILQARDLEGNPIVTITNYAKHPTFGGSEDTEVSADFIWGYREEMKIQSGGHGMYLQGFIAAVHGAKDMGGVDNMDNAYLFGKLLCEEVLAETENMTEATSFDIEHRATIYSSRALGDYVILALNFLDRPKRTFTYDENDVYDPEGPYDPNNDKDPVEGIYTATVIETSWHRLADAEFVVFPGEGDPYYSVNMREKIVSPYKFTVGLGNDALGYIVAPESVEADTSGQLVSYELMMGMGAEIGDDTYNAQESLGWFDGAWQSEEVAE